MRKRLITALGMLPVASLSVLGLTASGAAAAPAAATTAKVAPAAGPALSSAPGCGFTAGCYRNWQNCTTQDASTGSVGVTVHHGRLSSTSQYSQVYYIEWTSTSNGAHGVWWVKATSGGGGALYWSENDPVGSTNLQGSTNPSMDDSSLRDPTPQSQNPVVQTRFVVESISGPDTFCNVNLTFANPVS